MLAVADRPDGGTAVDRNHAHFAGRQADLRVGAFLGHQLGAGTGGADHLGTLAGLELDVVDDGTDRDAVEGHRVARHDIRTGSADDAGAGLNAFRSQDVGLFAIRILEQGQVGGAVGIVFQRFNCRRDVVFDAFPVDDTDLAPVAAADMADRDAAVAVAAAGFASLGQQFLFR